MRSSFRSKNRREISIPFNPELSLQVIRRVPVSSVESDLAGRPPTKTEVRLCLLVIEVPLFSSRVCIPPRRRSTRRGCKQVFLVTGDFRQEWE